MRSRSLLLRALHLAAISLCLTGPTHATEPTPPDFGNEEVCARYTGSAYAACVIDQSESCAQEVMKRVRPEYIPRMPFYTLTDKSVEAGTSDHRTRIDIEANDSTGKIGVTFKEDYLEFRDANGHSRVVGETKAVIKTTDIFSAQAPVRVTSQWGLSPVAETAADADVMTAYDLYQSCMDAATSGPIRRFTSQFPASFFMDKLKANQADAASPRP